MEGPFPAADKSLVNRLPKLFIEVPRTGGSCIDAISPGGGLVGCPDQATLHLWCAPGSCSRYGSFDGEGGKPHEVVIDVLRDGLSDCRNAGFDVTVKVLYKTGKTLESY